MQRRYIVKRTTKEGNTRTVIFRTQHEAFQFISDLIASGVVEITLKAEVVSA